MSGCGRRWVPSTRIMQLIWPPSGSLEAGVRQGCSRRFVPSSRIMQLIRPRGRDGGASSTGWLCRLLCTSYLLAHGPVAKPTDQHAAPSSPREDAPRKPRTSKVIEMCHGDDVSITKGSLLQSVETHTHTHTHTHVNSVQYRLLRLLRRRVCQLETPGPSTRASASRRPLSLASEQRRMRICMHVTLCCGLPISC